MMLPSLWRQWRKYSIGLTSHMLFQPFTPIFIQRSLIDGFGYMPWLMAPGIHEDELTLAGRRARRFSNSQSQSNAAVLFFHGGGFTTGSLTSHRPLCSHLAQATGLTVYSIDYRLAPEHTYPAAANDAEAATLALIHEHGWAADKLILAGDSAGGNLALTIAIRLRAHHQLPAALILMSPWADPADTSMPYRFDPIINPLWGMASARAYQGQNTATHDHGYAPIHANLNGLPPVLMQYDDAELLLPQIERLIERLQQAGVAVTSQRYHDLWHGGQLLASIHRPAALAMAACGDFVQQLNLDSDAE